MVPLARLFFAVALSVAASEGRAPKSGGQDIPPPPPDANAGTVPPPPPDANAGTVPPPPPDANTGTVPPPPPDANAGTEQFAPSAAAGNTSPPGRVDANLKAMVEMKSFQQNDPAAYQRWMTAIGPAYNRVFGDGAFTQLTDFQKLCQEKCSTERYMNTANFFQDAGRLARLEDDAKAFGWDHDSAEYKQRDAEIKAHLKSTVTQVQPARSDAPEVIKGFDSAYAPVKRIVMSGAENQNSAQHEAQTTDSAPSYNNLGNVLLQNGNAAAAQNAFGQALKRDGSSSDAYTGRAQADYNLGDYPAAAKDAASALDLNPDDQAARTTLLLSERRMPQGSWPELHNDLAKAAAGSGAALSTKVMDDGAVGGVAATGGGFSASAAAPALPMSNEAARKAEQFVAEARKDVQVGDARAAVAALQKAIAANPRDAEAFSLQAIAYSKLKDYTQMLAAAEGGLALAPNNRVLLNAKAFALNHLHDYKRAYDAASRAVEMNPRDAIAHFNKAQALAGLGDRKAMIAELKEAAALDKKFEAAYNASIQLPQDSDLTLLFPDDKSGAAAPSLLDMAVKGTDDPGWGAFALEAGVGALLMVGAALAGKKLFGGAPQS